MEKNHITVEFSLSHSIPIQNFIQIHYTFNNKNHKIKGITKSSKKVKRSIIVNPETILKVEKLLHS